VKQTEPSASISKGGVRVKSVSEQLRSPTGVVITNKLLLAAFVVLNVIDGIVTKSLPAASAFELNPIMSHTGWVFWTVKLGITVIVTLGLLFFEPRFPRQVKRILKGLVAGMAVICLFNLAVLISICILGEVR
jgi:hypothetical protein